MPTPLPVKSPPGLKPESVSDRDRGALPSGMSVKLEPSDPSMSGTLESGTIIAERYRIDSLIGEGGMGRVYAAEHVHMRKAVAIKVLHAEMSSTPEVVARFEREAVAAGKITHPNVATATDFGRLANSSFFLVLEYVAGTDLRAAIVQGPLAPERAVHILRQITSAVGAAHAAGVIHRDLKPENIMLVERDGDPDFVKVLDFGIAKLDTVGIAEPSKPEARGSSPGAAQPLTKMGAVFGTPDYMSPEQALGQPIDGRSDLYAIGVIFYELLTGRRPYKGGAVTLMRAHVLEAVPALPSEVLESVGPRYDAAIQKLLQKSATDRYANAGELLEALDELFHESVSPMPDDTAMPNVATAATALDLARQRRSLPRAESVPELPPIRKRRAFGPLSWLIVMTGIGVGLYWVVASPAPVPKGLWKMVATAAPRATSAASAIESAIQTGARAIPQVATATGTATETVATSAASATASAMAGSPPSTASAASQPPSLDTSSAPQAIDPGGPNETDEMTTGPDDSVTPPVGSTPAVPAASHHSGTHVTQTRPASKPIHKTNKPQAPAPRRPLIPPPSQWFK